MIEVPHTRYTEAADGTDIAYSIVGSGAVEIVGVNAVVPVEAMWEEPRYARFLQRLSSFSRLVWFDPRGFGSSGSLVGADARLVENIADDIATVLDTLGVERAVVLSTASAPPPALLFAAAHPSRVQGLVLFDPSVRLRRDDGYPGLSDEQVEQMLALIEKEWGTGVMARLTGQAGDEQWQRWQGRCERLMCSPREAVGAFRAAFDSDLRAVLPAISVPTLVVARAGTPGVAQSRYVFEHIAGARYVELPADRYTAPALDAVEEFVTGRLPVHDVDRVLATVLFTDIVSSTAQAASIGDRAWHQRLDAHDTMVRQHLASFRGKEVKTTGDGFLATFDGPARAIRCGCAVRDGARRLGIEIRVGLHTGEVELRADDIGGIAVHIAERVQSLAQSGEVLVSETVPRLVAGSGVEFEDRGEHELKGVPGTWRLYAVTG